MSTENSASLPVRMPIELLDKIKQAVELTGLSQQDMMRLCIRIGLVDLERLEWNIPGVLSAAAYARSALPVLPVTEEPVPFTREKSAADQALEDRRKAAQAQVAATTTKSKRPPKP